MLTHPFVQLLVTVVLAGSLTGVFTWYARRRGMLDIPYERHSHTVPTPRGGGAGIVAALVIVTLLLSRESAAMTYWSHCLLPGFVVLSLVGWWDDRVSLSASLRFTVQLMVSFYLLWCFRIHGSTAGLLSLLAAGIYLLWMTNLYNFMDGSNGMAGFQGVFAGVMMAWIYYAAGDVEAALVSSLLAGACVGFLPWNLGNARVFMGDVASGSLGFAFAALLIYGVFNGSMAFPVAWMVMLVFMCDSTLTLISRVLKGEQWYNPHKQHLYQQLIIRGWSHGRVLLLYQLVNLLLVAPAIVVAVNYPVAATVVASVITVALGFSWSLAIQKIGVLA